MANIAMPADDNISEQVSKLVAALEAMISASSKRVDKKHEFRFTSARQARRYSAPLASWDRNGRVGPPPVGTPGEVRAAFYSNAETASELKAFVIVANVMMVELAEAVLAGLRDGRIVVTFMALRGLIERIAHTNALAGTLTTIKATAADENWTAVHELYEPIHKALYGTQREWSAVARVDLRKATPKDLKYIPKENTTDASSVNILKSIDKLDRRVAGTRNAYEILCEFLHPNIGDMWASTVAESGVSDRFGTRHYIRTLGQGPKSLKGLSDHQVTYTKLLGICTDVVAHASLALDEVEVASRVVNLLTRKLAHRTVKVHRVYFANADLCPCLSGLTVRQCSVSGPSRTSLPR
jgi:hypothetical protein